MKPAQYWISTGLKKALCLRWKTLIIVNFDHHEGLTSNQVAHFTSETESVFFYQQNGFIGDCDYMNWYGGFKGIQRWR